MPRVIGSVAAVLAILCAYGLYGISVSTRRIETEVHALERDRDRLRAEIQVLRGDLAFQARPDRIEPLARLQGLGPLRPDQTVPRAELERRLGR